MHARVLFVSLLFSVLPVGFLSLTHAATWHIAKNGSNSNDGSAGAPFLTITKGLSVMSGGDTLIVHAGTYGSSDGAGDIRLKNGSSSSPTTLKGASGEAKPVLKPGTSAIDSMMRVATGYSWQRFDSVVLDAANSSGTRSVGFPVLDDNQHDSTSCADIIVSNSEIKNARHSGFLVAGTRWQILNNDVHHNGTEGLQSDTPDHGLYYSARNGTLDNNLIHDNDCYGIQNYSSVSLNVTGNVHTRNTYYGNGCGGIVFEFNDNGTFANNVVYNNAPSGITPAVLCCGANSKVFYNTIVDNSGAQGLGVQTGRGTDAGAQVRNNIICGNSGNLQVDQASTSNNVTTCPSFVNRSGKDFHLTAASTAPCLSGFTTDKDLVTRPNPAGGACDVGAYEYPATAAPPATPITVFVDTANLGGTASDSTACASAGISTPLKTIAAGLRCLTIAGSTLNIRAGTYNENIDTQAIPITGGTDANTMTTIQAYQSEVVTLSLPAGLHSVVDLRNNDAWLRIKNLRLDGNNISNSLVFFDGTHDCVVEGGEIFDSLFETVFVRNANNNTVKNTKIHTNTSTLSLVGLDGSTSGFILDNVELYDSPNPAVEDRSTSVSGSKLTRLLIHDVAAAAGEAAIILQGTAAQVINGVIYGGNSGVWLKGTVTTTKLLNNTIYGRPTNGVQIDSGVQTTTVTNNLVFGNGTPIANSGTGTTQTTNISTDPSFLGAASGNFHIPQTSTAKGVGTTLSEVPIDADGATRTVPYDVGAYIFTAVAGPLTIFVDANNLGGTANDATACASAGISTPRKTLAAGLACLTVAGSTLNIRAGVYPEVIDTGVVAVASGTASAKTTITAYGSEDVTLSTPAGQTISVNLRNTVAFLVLNRLIVRNNQRGQGLVFASGTNNVLFQNGEVVNTTGEAVLVTSANSNQVFRSVLHTSSGSGGVPLVSIAGTTTGFVLDQNDLSDTPNNGVEEVASTVSSSSITRNKFHELGSAAGKDAISVQGNGPQVVNNVVYGGTNGIQVAAASRTAKVYNNTVHGRPGTGIQVDSGAQTTDLTNNIAYQNGTNIVNNGTGTTLRTNVTTNPSFVDPVNGNFHIPSGSSAAGTGTTLATVTTDADGLARTVPYDVGAYVYTPTLAPVRPGPPWQTQGFFR